MGTMNDEESKMLKEIHQFLIGDLKEQGYIGKTDERIDKLEYDISTFKKVITAVVIPMILLVAEKVAEIAIK